MRRFVFVGLLALVLVGWALSPGEGPGGMGIRPARVSCPLRYPLVLSHHWGVEALPAGRVLSTTERELPPRADPLDTPALRGRNTDGVYRYFGLGIIQRLRRLGVRLYIADKSPFATNGVRARELRATVLRALDETGAAKVNIIGHSQGAQDSRLMISSLWRFDPGHSAYEEPENFAMGSRVASWTGLGGEARGTPVADLAVEMFDLSWSMHREISLAVDPIYNRLPTDTERAARARVLRQSFRDSLISLSMDIANQEAHEPGAESHVPGPDYPGVYYQSFAAQVGRPRFSWLDETPYWLLLLLSSGQGANDMYTSVSSQSYGELRAILGAHGGVGVHHMYFSGRGPEYAAPGFVPAAEFYAALVCDLSAMGY